MKRIISCIILILLLLPYNWVKAEVQAGNTQINLANSNLKAKDYPLGRKINLQGVFGVDRVYFNIDRYWDTKAAQINLIFSQSQLLEVEASTLTVYLNDNPIYSMSLKDKLNNRENISINLFNQYLKTGLNEVRLQVYRRISTKPCTDDVNNANWIAFYEDSNIHLEFEEKKPLNSIAQFPYPFIKASDSVKPSSIIMLPDNFGSEELQSALLVAANIGTRNKQADVDITLARYSEALTKYACDIIYIGKVDNTPADILQLLGENQLADAKSSGVLKITDSPYNNKKKVMCLIAKGGNGILEKGARLLSNDDLLSQLQGDSFVIDAGLDVITKAKAVDSHITLEKLGYSGILLKGMFRQQASIGIKLPKNRVAQPGSKFSLKMRYSKNLDFNKALATVYINGIPIGSKKLDANNADADNCELTIPKDALKGTYYDIKIAFDLEIPDAFCTFRQEEIPWVYITNDTDLYLPSNPGNAVVLENYPNPFITDGKWNDTAVVIPDHPSSSDLNMTANVLAYMGRELESNAGNFYALRYSDFAKAYNDKNLIVIGTPESNGLIKQLNGSLWFKYSQNFKAFLSNERKTLVDSYSADLTSIQLIPSPFGVDSSIMALTAPVQDNLHRSSKYLSVSTLIGKLYGDCVLLDSVGNVYNYYFSGNASKKESIIQRLNLGNTPVVVLIVFFGAVLVFIVLALVFYVRKNKRDGE